MSITLIVIFVIINIFIALWGLRNKNFLGVFKFPFIAACVNLTFILPQLMAIYNNVPHPDNYMTIALVHICLCTIAIWMGFYWGNFFCPTSKIIKRFNPQKILHVIFLFLCIGITAYFMNRGVYKGGKVSGQYVIVSFFRSFLNYALILTMIALYMPNRRINTITKYFFFIILLISIDNFLQQARRGSALYVAIIIGYYYMMHLSPKCYRIAKFAIPAIFLFGILFNTVIGQYRTNAYTGEISVFENIESLDFGSSNDNTQSNIKGEVNNGIIGINACYVSGHFDLGGSNWNAVIGNLIPSVLVGEKQKKSLMIQTSNDSLVEHLTRNGLTMTGFYDSFASFGIFGFMKFLIFSWFMGYLWKKRKSNVISEFLYVAMLTPGIHIITHSTTNILPTLCIYLIFIYPLLRYISIKQLNNRTKCSRLYSN